MVCLFEQRPDGQIVLVPQGHTVLFPSVVALQETLTQADASLRLGQLVLVGSTNDIAWLNSCLPEVAARHISAEIEYPLVSGWFREAPQMKGLTRALQQVLRP